MATTGKIRLLLVLLTASLFFTAIIIQKSYTPVSNLVQTAKTLEDNLHKKEAYVDKLLKDRNGFNELKTLQDNPQNALSYIQHFTADKSIWFITLTNGRLSFWSGVKIIPDTPAVIKEGNSFYKGNNGWYEAIKKSTGNFSAIFFIPVKINYEFQNQYLQNTFANDLTADNNIELANLHDKNIYGINSLDNVYLFSVKVKTHEVNRDFFIFELTFWILACLSLCVLIQSVCNYIEGKGYSIISIILLAVLITGIRFISLRYQGLYFAYHLDVFNPQFYNAGFVNPSFGDFCINIVLTCWFAAFLYRQRHRLINSRPGKIKSYLIFFTGILTLVISSTVLLSLFNGLVINSKISFDVSNILSLSYFSFLGVLMLCISFLIFYVLSEVFLTLAFYLPLPNLQKGALFGFSILVTTIIITYYQGFTFFYLLWGCLVFIRAAAYLKQNRKLDTGWLAVIISICALISTIKLNHFESVKENTERRAIVRKLENPDDANADLIFNKIEKRIIADSAVLQYFKDKNPTTDYIATRLQKLFFSGYLSKYDFKIREYNNREEPFSAEKNYPLNIFKDMVLYSSIKVSSYFYRENESFGLKNYFAILPISQNSKNYGTIIIELISRPLQVSPSFPGLLIDGSIKTDDDFKDYSYAFYTDDKLSSQSGNFVYDLTNTDLRGRLNTYTYKTTQIKSNRWYQHFTNYRHLIYKPSNRNLIIVSKEETPLFLWVTSFTFFFALFLIFTSALLLFSWLWTRIRIFSFKNSRIRWHFKFNAGPLLYKTRIQFYMVAIVAVTMILVGFITFFSISTQYQNQQEKAIREKIIRIAAAFESGANNKYFTDFSAKNQAAFNDFADTYSADLTLFNLNGDELITTQPKIYEFGLQAKRMNARAFINLKVLQKSEYINEEIIGKLNYKAAYIPVRNVNNQTIAYLQLPYFSDEADYKEQIGALINIMINVYAFVFLAIGFFAIVVARQITAPLSFIQQSLSKTIYGKKNEPIAWGRNDEIGALVKEYNKMIAELENSALKLAQSERESAWREMAKQVAHEIKNPLTPLKLGLQLLDKSWRDKDPKFDQKFERFSKSFVEQIESLSSIASEFSAFAKMPDTRLEKINIFETLNQAVTIFKQMDNVRILYQHPETPFIVNGDRDQILRCFNNLLKNAIEALPAERFGTIEINYTLTNKGILLTLKDNGNGIPEILRDKIFEPNFTTKSSGTGLGLAFVKNSIENAGGKVWFETGIRKGTTFFISLPAG